MAIAWVATSSVEDFTPGMTLVITLGAAPAIGNALVIGIQLEGSAETVTEVTDSQSNVYTLDHGPSLGCWGGDQDTGYQYYYSCTNITNAPTTVTIQLSAAYTGYAVAHEVSGMRSSGALDVTTHSGSAVGGTSSSFPFTTDFADEIAFFTTGQNGGAAITTLGTGWTLRWNTSGGNATNFLSRVLTSANTFNADIQTWDAYCWTDATIVSYRGLAGSTQSPRSMHHLQTY